MACLARERKVSQDDVQQEWNQKASQKTLILSSSGFSLRRFGAHFFKGDVNPSSVLWIKVRSYNHIRTLEEWGCSEKKGED